MTTTHTTLTDNRIYDAEGYLRRACPVMAGLIAAHGHCTLAELASRPFRTLVRAIIGQQLSVKAAGTIDARVAALVEAFTPHGVLRAPIEALRATGLSGRKVTYIRELSARVADGRLDIDGLPALPDEEIISRLTALPGIGRWTAEMFLIFDLKRPDVLSLGDNGLHRAVHRLFGEDATLPQASEPWCPYRSVASWYLWRSLD